MSNSTVFRKILFNKNLKWIHTGNVFLNKKETNNEHVFQYAKDKNNRSIDRVYVSISINSFLFEL